MQRYFSPGKSELLLFLQIVVSVIIALTNGGTHANKPRKTVYTQKKSNGLVIFVFNFSHQGFF